ncbi:unnamed protein product [Fusarium venenatum]|uniref:Uncharacterized protein n=1 Tax=Fusarium venenatum TaxID=56646 RepID=A0A2L2TH45_9HYPO|nr:uncharacterized protein FVRRES_09396 [Fusarium venenatum]CEI69319.1 unnamed protein product [Fusarium venenatum]
MIPSHLPSTCDATERSLAPMLVYLALFAKHSKYHTTDLLRAPDIIVFRPENLRRDPHGARVARAARNPENRRLPLTKLACVLYIVIINGLLSEVATVRGRNGSKSLHFLARFWQIDVPTMLLYPQLQ